MLKKWLRTPSSAGGRWPTGRMGGLLIMQSILLKERARSLRRNMTIAEKKLWAHLRSKRFSSIRFRRQAILGNYIIDFISFDPKIIIEVDGSQHIDQAAYDETRTEYLSSLGYKVLRFWNNDVLNNIEIVLNTIWNACFCPPIRPVGHLPPAEEGVLIPDQARHFFQHLVKSKD